MTDAASALRKRRVVFQTQRQCSRGMGRGRGRGWDLTHLDFSTPAFPNALAVAAADISRCAADVDRSNTRMAARSTQDNSKRHRKVTRSMEVEVVVGHETACNSLTKPKLLLSAPSAAFSSLATVLVYTCHGTITYGEFTTNHTAKQSAPGKHVATPGTSSTSTIAPQTPRAVA